MSQDYSEKDLHLFCRGEIRTDGWKSEWRKDLEQRQEEEARKQYEAEQRLIHGRAA